MDAKKRRRTELSEPNRKCEKPGCRFRAMNGCRTCLSHTAWRRKKTPPETNGSRSETIREE